MGGMGGLGEGGEACGWRGVRAGVFEGFSERFRGVSEGFLEGFRGVYEGFLETSRRDEFEADFAAIEEVFFAGLPDRRRRPAKGLR